jgi:hypothetical protein
VSFVVFCRKKSFHAVACGLIYWLLLLSAATIACADGNYQRTKDGKTFVWNDNPKPGDNATWSGDRDRDGYATGFGTLTWYTAKDVSGGEPKQTLYAYYFGNMVRGKFNGPVNGHSKGVTNHAVFTQGKRTGRWAAGPAPSWQIPRSNNEPSSEEVAITKAEDLKPVEFNPPRPSNGVGTVERPRPDYKALREQPNSNTVADIPAEGPNATEKLSHNGPAVSRNPKLEVDASLRSLTGPPAALRNDAGPSPASTERDSISSSSEQSRLSKVQVIELADAEARKQGYDLTRYARPDPQFDASDKTWSLFYGPTAVSATAGAKHFSIAIDDKTKTTAIVPGR